MPRRKKYRRNDSLEHLIFFLVSAFLGLLYMVLYRSVNAFLRWITPGVGAPSHTLKGEKVKSYTEKRIADYLHRRQIEYIYEKPLAVWFGRYIKPDFYLPERNLYVEYYGLLEHPKLGKRYRRERAYKRKQFARLGVQVIELDHRHQKNIEACLGQALRYREQKEKPPI